VYLRVSPTKRSTKIWSQGEVSSKIHWPLWDYWSLWTRCLSHSPTRAVCCYTQRVPRVSIEKVRPWT
jgi:hypothetical protein